MRAVRPTWKLKSVEEKLKEAKKEFIDMLPTSIQKEFDEKSFIGGGAIYSLYNGQEPKDYDFFVTEERFARVIHTAFSLNPNLKFRGGVKVGSFKGLHMVVTDNAISIGKFQIITRWVGTPYEVIGQFDFKHNMFYYQNGRVETVSNWSFLDDNKLRYNHDRARDICGTIIRVKKFVERGFTITNSEMSKMLLKLHEVGFNERELEILNSHDEERNNFGS
jgi:hypothetical protein